MKYFWVYILECRGGYYYVGHTDDIERRLAEHRIGQLGSYTSRRLPVELVFLQSFQTRDEAFSIEHRIKSWSRKKKEALIAGAWNELSKLSRKKTFTA